LGTNLVEHPLEHVVLFCEAPFFGDDRLYQLVLLLSQQRLFCIERKEVREEERRNEQEERRNEREKKPKRSLSVEKIKRRGEKKRRKER
jgi:hypothetical protein